MKNKKWIKDWLPQWPTQPNQYRLKKMYQLYYLFEDDTIPSRIQIQILDSVKQGHIIVWSSVTT
jgi:hypothetical protein